LQVFRSFTRFTELKKCNYTKIYNVVTFTSGGDVTGYDLTPVGRGMPRGRSLFSAVVGRHTARVALRSDGVQESAVRVQGKGRNKQTVVAKPLFTLFTRGPPGGGEILRGWCP
jgi:hypothetical protein